MQKEKRMNAQGDEKYDSSMLSAYTILFSLQHGKRK